MLMQPNVFSLLIVFELFYQDSCFMGLVPDNMSCVVPDNAMSEKTYETGYVIKTLELMLITLGVVDLFSRESSF